MNRERCASMEGWTVAGTGAAVIANACAIVATYRRQRDVEVLMDTLSACSAVPRVVVIVDGAQEPALEQWLRQSATTKRYRFDLRYVAGPKGLTLQRNAGIDASQEDLVFFLDDDSRPAAGYFVNIARVFDLDQESTIGGVCGFETHRRPTPLPRRWRLRFALRLLPKGKPMTYYPSAMGIPPVLMDPFQGIREVDFLPGFTMTFRRSVLDRERFSSFFAGYSMGEDIEMSRRVARRWRLVCCGEAMIVHDKSASSRPGGYEKGRMDVRNRYFIRKRHYPKAAWKFRSQFWADLVLQVGLDCWGFLVSRGQGRFALSHAAGLASGMVSCVFAPPSHVEPPAHRQYALVERFEEATR